MTAVVARGTTRQCEPALLSDRRTIARPLTKNSSFKTGEPGVRCGHLQMPVIKKAWWCTDIILDETEGVCGRLKLLHCCNCFGASNPAHRNRLKYSATARCFKYSYLLQLTIQNHFTHSNFPFLSETRA